MILELWDRECLQNLGFCGFFFFDAQLVRS